VLLTFPLFFSWGWMAARSTSSMSVGIAPAAGFLFPGVELSSHEQTDKADEAFIEIAKADNETVELQFALGSLFRRGGVARWSEPFACTRACWSAATWKRKKKLTAMNELGQDYLKAGCWTVPSRFSASLAANSLLPAGH